MPKTLISIKDKSASGDCYTVNTGTLMRLGANAGATAYYGTAEVKIKGLPREAGEFGIYIPLRAVTTPEIYKEYHDWCVAQNFSYLKCDWELFKHKEVWIFSPVAMSFSQRFKTVHAH